MPILTNYVAGVVKTPVYRSRTWGRPVRPNGTRYDVYLKGEPQNIWTSHPHTFDPFKASLCERAHQIWCRVTIATMDSPFGPKIISVELVEPGGRIEV